MNKSLGIFVTSDRHLDKVINLCKAAKKRGIAVHIFLSHLGTLLTRSPRFGELDGLASITLCKVAFKGHGLEMPVPGIEEKALLTQARNAELIEGCDRYVIL